MTNLEIAIRTEKAWRKALSILQQSGTDPELIRLNLHKVANIIRTEVPGNTELMSTILSSLNAFTTTQIMDLHTKWIHDAKMCAASAADLIRELRKLQKPWWKVW